MLVKTRARQSWRIFWDTVYNCIFYLFVSTVMYKFYNNNNNKECMSPNLVQSWEEHIRNWNYQMIVDQTGDVV